MSDRKYMAYSANDGTMASLLSVLGLGTNVDRPGMVTFASSLLVELWRRTDDTFFVKV
jgi:hypothetical protein